ncbi:Dual specificity phosphatase, catalytic domain [Rhizoctonia solani]|uniref:protein-tyrosine-phosphatase n=1 Tax=Rhizoctonia solani TaxID=456999 RepID=A0A8H7IMI6_9AGAM|nr:Dual specificity phosphatase, catalytic domain [Rhizoctonia solani]
MTSIIPAPFRYARRALPLGSDPPITCTRYLTSQPFCGPSTAETPSSPHVADQVTIRAADAAPAPVALAAQPSEQLSLQLPSSAASQHSTFSTAPPSTQRHDESDAASSSNATVQSHARRPPTLSVPVPQTASRPLSPLASPSVPGHLAATGAPMPASTSAFATRAKEDDNGAPYANGPIEILPGIWLGQEENARNWPDLASRGIRWVLNVAKEVAPPYMDDVPAPVDPREPPKTAPQSAFLSRRRPGPPPVQAEQPQPRAVPFVPPTGGPTLLYIHLPWSHGQSDLVKYGFPSAMSFVDHAQRKGQGVLIHCQCGVSRSATLVIALVMRASIPRDDVEVPEDLKSIEGGMHNAYAYVKERADGSAQICRDLIYQLMEYERALTPRKGTPSVSSDGEELSEEEEWSRKRLAMEREDAEAEAAVAAEEDRTREAKDLDRAMEERMAAKKAGPPAPLMLNPPPASGPTAWKHRFPSRKRAGSVHSTFTTSDSVISEDPEEDDDSEDGEPNITVVSQNRIELVLGDETGTSARTTTDEEASPSAKFVANFADTAPKLLPPPGRAGMKHKRSASLAISANSLPSLPPPPSAPASKMSFGNIPVPPTIRTSFSSIPPPPLPRRLGTRGPAPPSAPATKPGFSFPVPGSRASSIKSHSSTRRPTPLPTVPSSPVAVPTLATQDNPRAPCSSSVACDTTVQCDHRPFELGSSADIVCIPPRSKVESFVNPGPGVTPTPRKGSFGATRKPGAKRMSWLGMGVAPATPTTACSRVDAKGWVGLLPTATSVGKDPSTQQ